MKNKIRKITFAAGILPALAVTAGLFAGCGRSENKTAVRAENPPPAKRIAPSGEKLEELRLDYANWSPVGLVLRQQKFLEDEFRADGTRITWVFSQGSNKSMEFLRSNSIDIGSSAGVAALISFANGNPIKTVYISTTPEWTALLVKPGSDVTSVAGLKGKTIAATPGTDPYVFLVRALQQAGLSLKEVKVVTLQHPDGKNELLRGRIDAWAGLDPLMAQAELAGAGYLYRNVDFNTYNVISVRRDFAEKHPDAVRRVLAAYEKARAWAKAHPEEFVRLVGDEAKITPEVAQLLVRRTGLDDSAFTGKQEASIIAAGEALRSAGILKEGAPIGEIVGQLIDRGFFTAPGGGK